MGVVNQHFVYTYLNLQRYLIVAHHFMLERPIKIEVTLQRPIKIEVTLQRPIKIEVTKCMR